ncbi:MAG: YraN family protein [Pseudomonadota bacterium]
MTSLPIRDLSSTSAPTATPQKSSLCQRRSSQRATMARGSGQSQTKRRAHDFGVRAEKSIAAFLHAGGYDILARRERGRSTEVDLIAQCEDVIAFVEVKARRKGYGGLEAVDTRKQRQMSLAAADWLSRNPQYNNHAIRFDIALVWPTGLPEYIENAFDAVEIDEYCA